MGQVNQKAHFFIVGKYIHNMQYTHTITISESDKQTFVPKVRQWEVRSTIHQISFGKRNQRTLTVIRLLDKHCQVEIQRESPRNENFSRSNVKKEQVELALLI